MRLLVAWLVLVAAPPVLARPAGDVDAARIAAADSEPGSWLAHGRTYSEQRFSPLDQINARNVAQLGLAWSYMTGTRRGLEATPIVVDGAMYVTGSWSVVYALDAATGRELWRHDPQVPRRTGRNACCDVVNRGVAVWKGRVFVATIDGRLLALDARTGRRIWSTLTVDPALPYTITGAPRVVKDRVIIGNGGGEFGVRGYFSAYSASTGSLLWRFYTVPGRPDRPYEHPELEMAAATWSKDSMWEAGLGGTVWDSMAYDPELDLLYVGVGNSTPYNREVRSPGGGDNLFLTAILAVRPETGRLVWYYQTTPGENWDYTATQHMILADLEIGGRVRKVLMQAPKNGFFYVLDRATGELLSARKYVAINWASHVDPKTGRPVETGDAEWAKRTAWVMPGPEGGHNWHPMSFHPGTGLVYLPTTETVYPFTAEPDFVYQPGAMNTGEDFAALSERGETIMNGPGFCAPSQLTAWDPVLQKRAWRVDHDDVLSGGVLSTAGNLVFQGAGDGKLSAYRATTGEKLWESPVGIGIMAPPVSYQIDGVQYVAVLAGIGGSLGLNFMRFDYVNDGRLLVYKLGGTAPLPPVEKRPQGVVRVPQREDAPGKVERGRKLYARNCLRCHGLGAQSSGLLPDLRYSSADVHSSWQAIVRGGAFRSRGMASFADLIDEAGADDIQAYVVARAYHEQTLLEWGLELAARGVCIPATWLAD